MLYHCFFLFRQWAILPRPVPETCPPKAFGDMDRLRFFRAGLSRQELLLSSLIKCVPQRVQQVPSSTTGNCLLMPPVADPHRSPPNRCQLRPNRRRVRLSGRSLREPACWSGSSLHRQPILHEVSMKRPCENVREVCRWALRVTWHHCMDTAT